MFGFELEETGKISHQMKETARRFIEKGNLAQLLETLEKVTKENIYFYTHLKEKRIGKTGSMITRHVSTTV